MKDKLIAEAKERGLVNGATIVGFNGVDVTIPNHFTGYSYTYNPVMSEKLWICVKGGVYGEALELYSNGKWVTTL